MDVQGRLIELSNGMAVEEDALRIVETLQEYDPNIVVKFLNPNLPENLGDAPYAIFERCADGIERCIFKVWTLDNRVLERLWASDNQKHAIQTNLDSTNAKIKERDKRRFRESNGEVVDLLTHVLKATKTRYSFEMDGKKITVDDTPNTPYKVELKD